MQAAKASMNADNLLEELDQEKTREESKKAAAARRRERKKKKKLEKKEEKRKQSGDDNDDDRESGDEDDKDDEPQEIERIKTPPPADIPAEVAPRNEVLVDKEEGDSGIDANSQGSCSSNDVKSKEKRKEKKKKNKILPTVSAGATKSDKENSPVPDLEKEAPIQKQLTVVPTLPTSKDIKATNLTVNQTVEKSIPMPTPVLQSNSQVAMNEVNNISNKQRGSSKANNKIPHLMFEATPKPQQHPAEREDFEATGNETYIPSSKMKKSATYLSNNM